jgi:eukaryotic-like serine/threonine-protein kinase
MDVTTSVGRVLNGRYRVDELLGSGGMASVWRGRDLRLDRPVAIKELAGPWLADRRALRQFEREARMAARLAHHNVVAVHDVDIDNSTPFIVMELIEGATVAQLLANGPLPIETVVAVAAQACDGLAAAHAAGVIHRDIKPANLMLTDTGVVKICDFGIARGLYGAADPTVGGGVVAIGTSKYMAPEQASGGQIDARADLYGFGCTLYTMLAMRPPFQGTVEEVLAQHENQSPPPLRDHRADVPRPLEALVMRLLAKDPARRPTCVEIKAVLADLASPGVIPAPRAPVPSPRGIVSVPPAPPRRSRNIWYWPVAAVGLAVMLAVAAMTWLVPHRAADLPRALAMPPLTTTADTSAPPSTATAMPSQTPSSRAGQPTRRAPQPTNRTAPPRSPAPPSDPIAALRLKVQQQVSNGNLNPDKASDLYSKVDAIAHAANGGNTADEAKNVKAFKDKLTALRTGGQLTVAGYDILSEAADAISATLT